MKTKALFIAFLMSLLALSACKDDDSFSLSPTHVLAFSLDTVNIDTVFSNVPTPTRSFWVYNQSGDGLRCRSVRLANGAATGYRVNVDGQYLGASSDYAATDIEIRNKDSIRVFVELTSPENGQADPQLCEDNLVFTLESGVEQKVNLRAYTWDALKYTDVHITRDSTMRGAQKPVIVYGGVLVDSGATLRIAAGTTLYFHNDAGIHVYGTLVTEGEAGHEVVLRGDRIDHMFDYLPYDRVPGQWQGVHFYGSSYGNQLTYTDLHSAYDGVVVDSSDVKKQKLTLNNTTIHNCQGYGLHAVGARMTLANTAITNALNDCMRIDGGHVTVNHCTLAQYYPFDAARQAALRFTSTRVALDTLVVSNSLVTGYADDVVYGEQGDSTRTFLYAFDHCILRTPQVTTVDSVNFVDVVYEDVADTTCYGVKHFVKIDTDNLAYDFDLDSVSAAIGRANPQTSLPVDRKGRKRDDAPDAGAYEYTIARSEEP